MSLVIKFYFTSSMLKMFRKLIHPSSGACDFSTVSPHWLYVLVSMCVGVLAWLGWGGIRVAGCRTHNQCGDTIEKSQAPEDGCINIRNTLSIKKWNNKASDIKLVSLYSTIKMMHGPINIRFIINIIIRNVQTGPGAHLASYSMCTGKYFPGVKWPASEADHSTSVQCLKGEWVEPTFQPLIDVLQVLRLMYSCKYCTPWTALYPSTAPFWVVASLKAPPCFSIPTSLPSSSYS